jgi:CRP-like cAMP-binding protein
MPPSAPAPGRARAVEGSMRWVNMVSSLLEETDWGGRFDPSELRTIADYLVIRSYPAGQFIFREGDQSSYMAFISNGMVDIVKGEQDLTVTTLPHGTYLGELSLVDDMPRSASARAREDTTLLVLDKDEFDRIILDHPMLGVKMVKDIAKVISARLRATTEHLFTRPAST